MVVTLVAFGRSFSARCGCLSTCPRRLNLNRLPLLLVYVALWVSLQPWQPENSLRFPPTRRRLTGGVHWSRRQLFGRWFQSQTMPQLDSLARWSHESGADLFSCWNAGWTFWVNSIGFDWWMTFDWFDFNSFFGG